MVEAYTEERLFDRDGSNGAQFSLRNNFSGWNEKQVTELDAEEQRARIEQIKVNTDRLKSGGNENDEALDRLDQILKEVRDNALFRHRYEIYFGC